MDQPASATTPRRKKRQPANEIARVTLACGCVLAGFMHGSECPVAAELWDRTAVANKNLTRTSRLVGSWRLTPETTVRSFGPARVKVREAIYEYRRAVWEQHFQQQVKS